MSVMKRAGRLTGPVHCRPAWFRHSLHANRTRHTSRGNRQSAGTLDNSHGVSRRLARDPAPRDGQDLLPKLPRVCAGIEDEPPKQGARACESYSRRETISFTA